MQRVILAWAALLVATPALSAAARMTPECKSALADADRAARKGDPAMARAALDEAARLGADPPEGGECVARVLAKKGELAESPAEAARAYRRAAHRAVEHQSLWRTLSAARVRAEAKAQHLRTAERVTKLIALEAQVAALDRQPATRGRAAALDDAIAAFRADKDPVRAAWSAAVKAKVLAATGDAAGARALAEPLAGEAPRRPRFVRAAAHEALALAAIAVKDPEGEARAALMVDALRAELAGRSPDERRFSRSKDVERACARYEKSAGDGRCAALAREATGEFSFVDPSRARPRKTMSPDELERVQKQYSPVVESCVREVAKAHVDGELFENASIKVGWSVRGDGRAGEVEIEPRRYEAALGPCVRERVAWFRYPRTTDGQVHSVVLPFQLDVTERFGGRR